MNLLCSLFLPSWNSDSSVLFQNIWNAVHFKIIYYSHLWCTGQETKFIVEISVLTSKTKFSQNLFNCSADATSSHFVFVRMCRFDQGFLQRQFCRVNMLLCPMERFMQDFNQESWPASAWQNSVNLDRKRWNGAHSRRYFGWNWTRNCMTNYFWCRC